MIDHPPPVNKELADVTDGGDQNSYYIIENSSLVSHGNGFVIDRGDLNSCDMNEKSSLVTRVTGNSAGRSGDKNLVWYFDNPTDNKDLAPSVVGQETEHNYKVVDKSSSVNHGDETLVRHFNSPDGDKNLATSLVCRASDPNSELVGDYDLNIDQSFYSANIEPNVSIIDMYMTNHEEPFEEALNGFLVESYDQSSRLLEVVDEWAVDDEWPGDIDIHEIPHCADWDSTLSIENNFCIQDMLESDGDIQKSNSANFQNGQSPPNCHNGKSLGKSYSTVCDAENMAREVDDSEPNTLETDLISLSKTKSLYQEAEIKGRSRSKEETLRNRSAMSKIVYEVEQVDDNEMFHDCVSPDLKIGTSHNGRKDSVNLCKNASPSTMVIQVFLCEETKSILENGMPGSSDQGKFFEVLDTELKEETPPTEMEMDEIMTSTVEKRADDITHPSNVIQHFCNIVSPSILAIQGSLQEGRNWTLEHNKPKNSDEDNKIEVSDLEIEEVTPPAETKIEETWASTIEKCAEDISRPPNEMPPSTNSVETTAIRKSARLAKLRSTVGGAVPMIQSTFAGAVVPDDPAVHYMDVQKLKKTNTQKKTKRAKSDIQESTTTLETSCHSQKIDKGSSEDYSLQKKISGENSENKFGEKTTIETTETSLIIYFPESDALPSEAQLIDIFSRYGPLVEELTEVRKQEKEAHVVFKVRRDAETAYTDAGKSNPFAKQVFYGMKFSSKSAKIYKEKEQ